MNIDNVLANSTYSDKLPHYAAFHLGLRSLPNSVYRCFGSKIVNEYDQEIPQSQTADNPVAP